MPSTTRKAFKTRIHRRVAAATLASFALALGAVTFAGSPLPQTTSTAQTTTAADTSSTSSSTSRPASSSTSGQTSSATLTTSTS